MVEAFKNEEDFEPSSEDKEVQNRRMKKSKEPTKMLQSDTMSLSLVVPAFLDRSAHLSQFSQGTAYRDLAVLAQKMKANMEQRFLDSRDSKFSPPPRLILERSAFLNLNRDRYPHSADSRWLVHVAVKTAPSDC
ncbi:unnamed protein product [Pleuronectes platessa]|uniref:Uncharacterized protein n=1 Tax=Pleuronectes platessa TaxID=8262 RepID=A0A9N7USH4_PLEPL|nr:unnamed protein product [Pleuronectes platessa]